MNDSSNVIRFPTHRARRPSPYTQALIDLAASMDHCRAIMEAVESKLPPKRIILWDDRPCDTE